MSETGKETRRFTSQKSLSGIIFIKDAKDGSMVAAVLKAKRPADHTEAMAKTMVDALNNAVEGKHGGQHQ